MMSSQFDICPACSLILDWTVGSKSSDVVSAFSSTNGIPQVSSTNFVCQFCLGVLQPTYSERVVTDVLQNLRSTNYDANSFSVAVSLPPSCMVREKVAKLIKGKYETEDDTDQPYFQITLKDACRICYQSALECVLSTEGITHNAQSDFVISVIFENKKADELCSFLPRCFPDRFSAGKKKRRDINGIAIDGNNAEWSRIAITDILPLITAEMVEELDLASRLRNGVDECSFTTCFIRSPLFVGGRYCKYSRYLSQTPWIVDGVRRGESSVQELISEHVMKAIGCDEVKFTSSGREDTDVRMLGMGRPFCLQFVNPRRKRTLDQSEMEQLQNRVNSSTKDVQVLQLRTVAPNEFSALKVGEEHKKKTYVALVWSSNSLNDQTIRQRILDLQSLGIMEIEQKTPIRVLHRRPLATRRRTVERFGVIPVNEHYFQLRLTTQAGTYIKEFVHGDFGRTKPSLSDLLGGIPVDILELDVERIDLDWP